MNADSSDAPAPLPTTVEAQLAVSQVDDLFRDLSACVDVQHISVKSTQPDANAALLDHLDLVQARWLLDQGSTKAVQVRYRFEDALWVDTLTKIDASGSEERPGGDGSYRLIRVQHPS